MTNTITTQMLYEIAVLIMYTLMMIILDKYVMQKRSVISCSFTVITIVEIAIIAILKMICNIQAIPYLSLFLCVKCYILCLERLSDDRLDLCDDEDI